MNEEVQEGLVNLAKNIAEVERELYKKKLELDLLKADYILLNDWEKLTGKAKPTQKDKDSYVEKGTADRRREIDNLTVTLSYMKRLYEVNLLAAKRQV